MQAIYINKINKETYKGILLFFGWFVCFVFCTWGMNRLKYPKTQCQMQEAKCVVKLGKMMMIIYKQVIH